jgi:tetratricopeptide (TPR) repeat protein
MATSNTDNTTDLKIALEHTFKLLRDNRVDEAEQQAREILRVYPGEVNASRILGAALRLQKNYQAAIELLQPITVTSPGFALAWQELGLCYSATGRITEAVATLKRAVEGDPTLATSWRALGELYLSLEDHEAAEASFQQHLQTTTRDPELIQVVEYLNGNKVAQAERSCREYLKRHPTDVNAIRLLAEIGIKLRVFDDAENLLARCLELAPDFHLARLNYASALSGRQKPAQALEQLEILERSEPEKPSHLMLKAVTLTQMGSYPQAIALYEKLLSKYTPQATTLMSYGHALKTVGRQVDAIAAYSKAIELKPDLGDAYWSMANLKTFTFDDAQIETMKALIETGKTSKVDFFHLCFALGKALEDKKDFEQSFRYYARGNEVKKRQERYNSDLNHNNIQRTINSCTADLFADNAGAGCQSPDPIFIVGLPRSGSTLLEQILSSHSLVDGTKELPDIISISRRIGAPRVKTEPSLYPEILQQLPGEQLAELGEEYLARASVQRGDAPFFIDKMPNNFAHIGLIQLILPNAKIIDARRHPMDTCFSGFKQLFASGQRFTYGLADIGRYYCDYVALMDHWDSVLPSKVLRVQYEDVVADTEAQIRRILDYCGLEFESACLDFHQNRRAVRTASSEQVRQPINTRGIGQWRPVEAHLDELKQALEPVLERYPLDAGGSAVNR